MNYDTLVTQTFISSEMLQNMEHDPDEYLKLMLHGMTQQLAVELVKRNLGKIDEQYDIRECGKRYTLSIKIVKEEP